MLEAASLLAVPRYADRNKAHSGVVFVLGEAAGDAVESSSSVSTTVNCHEEIVSTFVLQASVGRTTRWRSSSSFGTPTSAVYRGVRTSAEFPPENATSSHPSISLRALEPCLSRTFNVASFVPSVVGLLSNKQRATTPHESSSAISVASSTRVRRELDELEEQAESLRQPSTDRTNACSSSSKFWSCNDSCENNLHNSSMSLEKSSLGEMPLELFSLGGLTSAPTAEPLGAESMSFSAGFGNRDRRYRHFLNVVL